MTVSKMVIELESALIQSQRLLDRFTDLSKIVDKYGNEHCCPYCGGRVILSSILNAEGSPVDKKTYTRHNEGCPFIDAEKIRQSVRNLFD